MIVVSLITDFSDLTDLYSWLQNQKIRKSEKSVINKKKNP